MSDPKINNALYTQQKECQFHHKAFGVYKNTLVDDTYQFRDLSKKSSNLAHIESGVKVSKQ